MRQIYWTEDESLLQPPSSSVRHFGGSDGWEFVVTPLLVLAVSIMDSIESMLDAAIGTEDVSLSSMRQVAVE